MFTAAAVRVRKSLSGSLTFFLNASFFTYAFCFPGFLLRCRPGFSIGLQLLK